MPDYETNLSPIPQNKEKWVYERYSLWNWTISLCIFHPATYYAYKIIILKKITVKWTQSISFSFEHNSWVYNFDS